MRVPAVQEYCVHDVREIVRLHDDEDADKDAQCDQCGYIETHGANVPEEARVECGGALGSSRLWNTQ